MLAREVVILLLQVFVILAPIFTPTKRSDAQPLVECEKNNCPRKRSQNRGMPCNSIWIPTFVV